MRYTTQVDGRQIELDVVGPADKGLWDVSRALLEDEGRDFEAVFFGSGSSTEQAVGIALKYLRSSVSHSYLHNDIKRALEIETATDPRYYDKQDAVGRMYCQLLVGRRDETTP